MNHIKFDADYYRRSVRADRRTFAARLRRLRLPPGTRLLDIGAGVGTFVDLARAAGIEAYGIEAQPGTHPHITYGTVAEVLPRLAGEWAVITLWDTVEHFADPCALLRDLHARLHAEGRVIFTTPITDSWPARLLGPRWWHFKPREHLTYYTRWQLVNDLARANFELLTMRTISRWRTGEALCGHPSAARWIVPTYFGDEVYVEARKDDNARP